MGIFKKSLDNFASVLYNCEKGKGKVMRLFDKRPLCYACSAALLLGLLFAYTGIYAVISAAAVCAACFILVFALKYRYRKTLAVVFSAALVLCLSFSVFYITSSVVEYDDAEIKGYVLPYSENEYTQIHKSRLDRRCRARRGFCGVYGKGEP